MERNEFSKVPSGGSINVNFGQFRGKEPTRPMNKTTNSHTQDQLARLERMYNQCPHPEAIQRVHVGEKMGIDSKQIKHWFQNKKQQLKDQAIGSSKQNLQQYTQMLHTENGNNKRKNPTLPIIDQASLAKKVRELFVPHDQLFKDGPHIFQNHIAPNTNINTNTNTNVIAPQQNIVTSLTNCVANDVTQNVVTQDVVTHLFDQNIDGQDVSAMLREEDIPNFEKIMTDLTNALHDQPTPAPDHANVVHDAIPTPDHVTRAPEDANVLNDIPAAAAAPAPDNRDKATVNEDVVAATLTPHPITLHVENEKKMIRETANKAMEELTRLLQLNEPFWFRSRDNGRFILHREMYDQMYNSKSSFLDNVPSCIEASKDSMIVSMNAEKLVGMFLNSEKWGDLFPTIVTKAQTVEVFEEGSLESRDGSMQWMTAKMQILSPLVPIRKISFLRYCKNIKKGEWTIADVSISLESLLLVANRPNAWKFPSGCMIQAINNETCRVSWLEHIQVADKTKTDVHFRKKICANNGYRATRWLLTLERMCQRIITENTTESMNPFKGKMTVMKLGERMLKMFYEALDMNSTRDYPELNTLDSDGLRVCVRKCSDSHTENGVILTASNSFWLPCSPDFAFDFFKDTNRRFQWDVLCNGYPVEEIHRIQYGTNPGNFTSIIRPLNPEDTQMRIVQECYSHAMESGLVYCVIDAKTVNCAIRGEDCSMMRLLPSGFTISGDDRFSLRNKGKQNGVKYEGSIVTVAYQLLIGKPSAMDKADLGAVKKMNKFVNAAINRIKVGLNCLDS